MKKIIFLGLLMSGMTMVGCKSGQVSTGSEPTSVEESSEQRLSNGNEAPTLQHIDPSIRLNKHK